jgi:putative hydrolase of the HAD superfamily
LPDLRALILDFGGVLSHQQPADWYRSMAAELGVPEAAFRDAYWQHRTAYDSGLPVVEYWRRVHETLGQPDAPTTLEHLIESDLASWTHYREEVWAMAHAFREAGGLTGFLSNSGPEMMVRVRADRSPESRFDVVIVSCEVGLAKPDPRIYELALSRLGVAAGQALFVDDREDNIEGATRLGLITLHFVDDQAVGRLRALITAPGTLGH